MQDFEVFVESVVNFNAALLRLIVSLFRVLKWFVNLTYPLWVQFFVCMLLALKKTCEWLGRQPANTKFVVLLIVVFLLLYKFILRRVLKLYKVVRRTCVDIAVATSKLVRVVLHKVLAFFCFLQKLVLFLFPLLVVSTLFKLYLPSNVYRIFQNSLISFIPLYNSVSVILSYYVYSQAPQTRAAANTAVPQTPASASLYNKLYTSVKKRLLATSPQATPSLSEKRLVVKQEPLENTPSVVKWTPRTIITRKLAGQLRRPSDEKDNESGAPKTPQAHRNVRLVGKSALTGTARKTQAVGADKHAAQHNTALKSSALQRRRSRIVQAVLDRVVLAPNYADFVQVWLFYWIVAVIVDWLFAVPVFVTRPCRVRFQYGLISATCRSADTNSYKHALYASSVYLYNLAHNALIITILTQQRDNLLELRRKLQTTLDTVASFLMGWSPLVFLSSFSSLHESTSVFQRLWNLLRFSLPDYGVLVIKVFVYAPQVLLSLVLPAFVVRLYILAVRLLYPLHSSSYYLDTRNVPAQVYWLLYFTLDSVAQTYVLFYVRAFLPLQFELLYVWLLQFLCSSPDIFAQYFCTCHFPRVRVTPRAVPNVAPANINSVIYYISSSSDSEPERQETADDHQLDTAASFAKTVSFAKTAKSSVRSRHAKTAPPANDATPIPYQSMSKF